MRNRKSTFGILALSVLLTFSGCQKDDSIMAEMENAKMEYNSTAYQLADISKLENPTVTGATATAEFKIQGTDHATSPEHSLSHILKQLNLTENQRKAIKGYVEEHAICIEEHRAKVQKMHQDLLKRANAKREEYVNAYKAGRITKPELDEKLKSLHEKLKEEVQKLEQKQFHIRIIRKCRTELFKNIASVLDREQLHKFHRWVQSLK